MTAQLDVAPCWRSPIRAGPCPATGQPQPWDPSSSFIPGAGSAANQRESGRVCDLQARLRERTSFREHPADSSSLCSQQDVALGALSSRPQPQGPICSHGLGDCKSPGLQWDRCWWHREQRKGRCPGTAQGKQRRGCSRRRIYLMPSVLSNTTASSPRHPSSLEDSALASLSPV